MGDRAEGNADLPCVVIVGRAGWLAVAICHTHGTASVALSKRKVARNVADKCREIIEPEQAAEEWWQNQW